MGILTRRLLETPVLFVENHQGVVKIRPYFSTSTDATGLFASQMPYFVFFNVLLALTYGHDYLRHIGD